MTSCPVKSKLNIEDGTTVRLAVHGGFVQVDTSAGAAAGLTEGDGPLPGLSTRVTVLAGIAELATEIDVPRAEAAKEAATARVAELGGSSRAPSGSDADEVIEDLELIEALRLFGAGRTSTRGGRRARLARDDSVPGGVTATVGCTREEHDMSRPAKGWA